MLYIYKSKYNVSCFGWFCFMVFIVMYISGYTKSVHLYPGREERYVLYK